MTERNFVNSTPEVESGLTFARNDDIAAFAEALYQFIESLEITDGPTNSVIFHVTPNSELLTQGLHDLIWTVGGKLHRGRAGYRVMDFFVDNQGAERYRVKLWLRTVQLTDLVDL